MKVVILAAGIGSRLRPLTENKPKFLLEVKNKILGEIMMENLLSFNLNDFIFIVGHQKEKVINFVKNKYKNIQTTFIENNLYDKTNTAYSLWLTKKYVYNNNFIKIDGDVFFEKEVIKKLINEPYSNCLLIDTKIHLDKEEVKVITDKNNFILEVGKKINPKLAKGESIGIEKISASASKMFFSILDKEMKFPKNFQNYYDDYYTTLNKKGIKMKALDISDYKWIEVDSYDDYKKLLNLI